MIITVDRVVELKDFMIELLWAFVFALYSIVKQGNEIPRLMHYLVPFFSSILFDITKRFIFSILVKFI